MEEFCKACQCGSPSLNECCIPYQHCNRDSPVRIGKAHALAVTQLRCVVTAALMISMNGESF